LLQAREDQGSTAIGHAVAIPHAYLQGIEHLAVLDAEEEPEDEETHWAA